jgi:NADH-quinone oxidoreductase subunit H
MNFFIVSLIKAGLVAFVLLTTLAYLQWIERKMLAHIQLRVGPYRVGPHGLLQPLADVIKLVTKEGMIPSHVNKLFYLLAPFLAVMLSLVSISVIPFGPEIDVFGVRTWMQLSDLDIGVLFVLAISSVGVYGVALAGWASNNKYSLIGGLRSSAQMISYELPLALAVAAPLLLANTLSFRELVDHQTGYYWGFIPHWNLWPQIVGFLIFLIAGFAETNRVPFDLPEAENELVAGFHVEYSSMTFAAFFMAEYANMLTVTCVATLLFLGGWTPAFPAPYSNFVPVIVFAALGIIAIYHGLHPARRKDRFSLPVAGVVFLGVAAVFLVPLLQPILMPLFWFAAKVGGLLFVFIWIRGTLPRFRYDQLMRFAWTVMFPLAMLNLLITGLVVALS